MKKTNLYVDIHVLQTVPPSCVNRDDTGSPKTAPYGGVTRARVSSQAWKRSMRVMFRDLLAEDQVGMRTKHIPELLAEEILTLDPEQGKKANKLAQDTLKKAGVGISKKNENETDALFFISKRQLKTLAEMAVNGVDDKTALQNALRENPSVDIALFGRMVASDPSLNFDAAAQVAHAISTHAVRNEYDYFTAVDDCSPADNAGAGHLGTVEFNSSTLYRYATVNVGGLSGMLSTQEVSAAVRAFAEAFICSMPTGKQNTFANRTLPDLVYLTVRRDTPVNLCGAFEKPIPAGTSGYVAPSEAALARYAAQVYATFADKPEHAWLVGAADGWQDLAEAMPLNRMLDSLAETVTAALPGEEE